MPYVQLPGTKFVIPKDDIAKNYTKVVQFLEGDKALLGHRGSRDAFKNSQLTRKILLRSTLE
jgi:hypothetical protein